MMTQPRSDAAGIKVAMMASAAGAVEWYDFFVYGTAAALVFPKLFFPAELPLFVAQIAAFSTFAVGFIARPIGGALFGHFGDLHGRKRALVLAMLIMGIATTAIGLLPGYATAGALAPLMLVVLRFIQGLAVGGQWGGAALLAIESAPANKRGFYSSFVQLGVPLGVVLANLVFLAVSALVDARAFAAWGWRVSFLLSIGLIIVGLYMNRTVREDVEARPAASKHTRSPSPILTAIRGHGREILLAGGAFVANNTCFYVAITYVIAYGTATVGLPKETLLFAVMFGSVAMIPALIACGALSDRFGRAPIFILGAILSGLWAFAVFPLIDTQSPILVTVAITVELLAISLMYGPQAALFAELFPKNVRYSGASLGYQIGSVVGGGFAPIIATALFAHYHSSVPLAFYLLAMCLISLISVVILARMARHRPVYAD
jgi:MFS family permease